METGVDDGMKHVVDKLRKDSTPFTESPIYDEVVKSLPVKYEEKNMFFTIVICMSKDMQDNDEKVRNPKGYICICMCHLFDVLPLPLASTRPTSNVFCFIDYTCSTHSSRNILSLTKVVEEKKNNSLLSVTAFLYCIVLLLLLNGLPTRGFRSSVGVAEIENKFSPLFHHLGDTKTSLFILCASFRTC